MYRMHRTVFAPTAHSDHGLAHPKLDCACDAARNVTGTLDGLKNPGDVLLYKGDNRTLECDLLPPGTANRLDGYWKATVNGEEAEIVSVNMTDGRALIRPPSGFATYEQLGQIQVKCQFYSKQDEPLFEFDRNVTVLGEYSFFPISLQPLIYLVVTTIFSSDS